MEHPELLYNDESEDVNSS